MLHSFPSSLIEVDSNHTLAHSRYVAENGLGVYSFASEKREKLPKHFFKPEAETKHLVVHRIQSQSL